MQCDCVFAEAQVFREVEHGGRAAVLRIAHLFAVEPYPERARHPVEFYEYLAVAPVLRHFKVAAVQPDRVAVFCGAVRVARRRLVHDPRRILLEGIFYVGV